MSCFDSTPNPDGSPTVPQLFRADPATGVTEPKHRTRPTGGHLGPLPPWLVCQDSLTQVPSSPQPGHSHHRVTISTFSGNTDFTFLVISKD